MPNLRQTTVELRMYGLCVEQRSLNASALSWDIAHHMYARILCGKIAVVTDKPKELLAATRKQWLKLCRQAQIEQASTLDAGRILELSHHISCMQNVRFSAQPVDDLLEADITFAMADDFVRIPPVCPTVYVTYGFDREKLHMLTSWMPKHGLVVLYGDIRYNPASMIISIDESGTHRQNGYSIVALICIPNLDALAELNEQIETLERAIGTTNFHWAVKGWPFRRDFVQGLRNLDFSIRLIQLNNPVQLDKALEDTLPYVMPERNIARLFIDGKKHKQYARTLKKVLRDKGITVKKLKTVNDTAYPSIRVADAVAGAARYYLDNPSNEATKLYKALEPKIEFIHVQK